MIVRRKNLRRWALAVVAGLAGMMMPIVHGAAQDSSAQPASLSLTDGVVIGTGAPIGVYFAVGNAICRLVQRETSGGGEGLLPSLGCAVTASGGSVPNIEALRAGTIDFGIVQSDWMFHAARGSNRFAGRKLDKLRALFSLHVEPFQLLAARNLGIAGLVDLKARKVNIGPSGTAQHEIMTELFRLHKLEHGAFAQVLGLPPAEQFQAFCAGDIEAFGMLIGFPNTSFAEVIRNCGGSLVDMNTEPVKGLLVTNPFYAAATIPKEAYPGLDKSTVTFGVLAIAATTSDISVDTVYRFVRSVFERLDDLKAMHPALADLMPYRMIRDGITVPLHPGAEKYYRERGWM